MRRPNSGSGAQFVSRTQKPNYAPDPELREAARTQPFWLLVAAFFFGNACSQTLHVHKVAYLVDTWAERDRAGVGVSVVGLASIFARTGGGCVADRVGGIRVRRRDTVWSRAPSCCWRWRFADALGRVGYAVLLGRGLLGTASLTPAMVSDRFSGRHFGAIVGIGLLGARSAARSGRDCRAADDTTVSYTVPSCSPRVVESSSAAAGCACAC